MAARFCPSCGRPVAPTAAFCASCGTPMPPPGTVPVTYGAMPPQAIEVPYSSGSAALPEDRLGPVDRRAMDYVLWAAVIGLVAVVASFVLPYGFGFSLGAQRTLSGIFSGVGVVYGLAGIVAGALVLYVLQFWFFYRSFHSLAAEDTGQQAPATLALLTIFGAIILFGSVLWLLTQAYSWVQCAAGTTPIPNSCIPHAALFGALGLIVVGAIVYLIGVIGVWLGLWRLGTRYNESMFKIGMVLSIFPFVDIVGYILLLLAARQVRARIAARATRAPR